MLRGLREELAAATAAPTALEARAAELAEASDDELEVRAALDELGARAQEAWQRRTDAQLAERRIAEREQALGTARTALQTAEQRLAEIGEAPFDPTALEEVRRELQRLDELARKQVEDRALLARIPELDRELLERQAALAELTGRKVDLAVNVVGLHFDAAEHAAVAAAAREAQQTADEAGRDVVRARERVASAAATEERAHRALAEYDARAGRLRELRDQVRVHTAAAERLDAFRIAQASSIRPELEELTSGFVSILTDGRHEAVEIDEDFVVTLQEGGIATEVVSGGTEDIAALAMRLAMSQMIAERAGHPLSLLVLDEPFGSLDETRRGNVLALIRRLREVFVQTIVISHVAETRDAVDYVIELEYDEAEGRSRIVSAPMPVEIVEEGELELAGAA